MVAEGRFTMLASPALFLEYEDVLSRPEQRKVHRISIRDIELLLRDLASLIEPVETHFRWRPQLHDADDEMVLETAMNGRADGLVTHNRRDFLPASRSFRLRVLSPGEVIKEMNK
jgi:putative PIN family toxin of toxin-antitoxin system